MSSATSYLSGTSQQPTVRYSVSWDIVLNNGRDVMILTTCEEIEQHIFNEIIHR